MTGTAFKSATGLAAMTRKRGTGPEELLDLYFEPVAAPPVNRPLYLSMAPSGKSKRSDLSERDTTKPAKATEPYSMPAPPSQMHNEFQRP